MAAVLCDLGAWITYASRAPLQRIPEEEADRALRGATRTAAQVSAVRELSWFGEQDAFGRRLGGVSEGEPLPIALLCREHAGHRAPAGSRIRTLPKNLEDAPLLRVADTDCLYVVAPELYLLLRAKDLPAPLLAAVACELCGTYEVHPELDPHTRLGVPSKLDPALLKDYAQGLAPNVTGAAKLRGAAAIVGASRSPIETAIAVLAASPPADGGMGLPAPKLNCRVDLGAEGRRILGGQRSLFVDVFWPEAAFGIEYDSTAFHGEHDRQLRDKRRQEACDLLGIDIVPWTWQLVSDEVASELAWRRVAERLGVAPRWDERTAPQRRMLRGAMLGPHLFW